MKTKIQSFALAAMLAIVPSIIGVAAATPAGAATDPVCSGTVTTPCLFHDFEIDGDTPLDGGGTYDWASPPVSTSPALNTFTDCVAKGPNACADNIFTNGSKESVPSKWQCGTNTAPSKNDLAGGQLWFQNVPVLDSNGQPVIGSDGKPEVTQYLYGNFTRVSPNGDAHIDYEFNKATSRLSGSCSALPVRQKNDVLIAFDTNNGGATITVTAYKYSGSAWMPAPAGQYAGLSNIPPARSDSSDTSDFGKFGEAGFDLTDTVGTFTCGEFGAAWMKTRAAVGGSGLVTDGSAALKDYTTPQKINTGNCPNSSLTKLVRDASTNPPGSFASTATSSPGDTIDYKLTYNNAGPGTATNVVVSDPIPAHETLKSGSCALNGTAITCPTVTNGSISFPSFTATSGTTNVYTFSVTLDKSFTPGSVTPISNTATSTDDQENPSSSTATVTVNANNNLVLTKKADSSIVSAGSGIGYTITLDNTKGNSDVTGVTLTDALPTNNGSLGAWTFDNPTQANKCTLPTASPQTLTCSNITVAAGGTWSVHVATTTTQATCGTVSNTASATVSGVTGTISSNPPTGSGATQITVTCPKSGLVKSAQDVRTGATSDNQGQLTAQTGDTITYTLKYTNAGTGAASAVTVTDPIPAHETVDISTCMLTTPTGTAHVNCTVAPTSPASTTYPNTLSFPTVSTVASQGTLTYTFNATIDSVLPQGGATLTNIGHVSTMEEGDTKSNPVSVNVSATAVLQLVKMADSPTVNAGDPGGSIGYLITLSNSGNSDATGVTLTDPLPTNTGLGTWSITTSPVPTGCGIAPDPTTAVPTLTCSNLTVPAGHMFSIHIAAPSTPTTCTTVSNQAHVSATGVSTVYSNPPGGTQPGTTDITVTCPSSQLDKSAQDVRTGATSDSQGQLSAKTGDTITYTVKYTNTGTGAASNVTVTDPIPAHETVNTSSCKLGTATVACTVAPTVPASTTYPNTLSFPTVSSVASQGTLTYTFNATIDSVLPAGTNSLVNVAIVHTDQEGNTPSNPIQVNVGAAPMLTLTKDPDASSVNDGEKIGYKITLHNQGNADASSVQITDPLTTGLTWGFDSATTNVCSIAPDPNTAAPTLTCNVGALKAGDTWSVHVSATSTSANCPGVMNTAHVTASGNLSADSAPTGSDPGTATTITVNCANVSIAKTADHATVSGGSQVGYTLVVTNAGPGTAKNVVVSDNLPSTISGLNWMLTPAVTGCGITGAVNSQVLSCAFPTMAPGSVTLHVVAQTSASNCGVLSNNATVSSDNGGGNTVSNVVITVAMSTAGASTHGSAYGLNVNVLGLPLLFDHTAQISTSAPTGPPTAARHIIVLPLAPIVNAAVINTTSDSSTNGEALTTATSEVANVSLLGGAITADAIEGVSQSVATPQTASYNSSGSTFANLVINGKQITNVSPNTSVTVYVPGTKTKLASVVLYEQSGTSGLANGVWSASHSVTMIDITLLAPLGTLPAGARITVAQAQSDATYPSGLGCGVGANTVSGNAFTAWANGTFINTTLVNAQVGDAELPVTGGSDTDNVLTVPLSPLAAAGAGVNTTTGQTSGNPTATSGASVANVNLLGGLVTANAIDVTSSSVATSTTGTSTFGATCSNGTCPTGCVTSSPCFVNLAVGGHTIVGINGGTVAPNTVIAIPQPDGSLVEVILNEQIPVNSTTSGNTSGDINAIHVYVLKGNGLLSAEVIVAHAHSDAHHI